MADNRKEHDCPEWCATEHTPARLICKGAEHLISEPSGVTLAAVQVMQIPTGPEIGTHVHGRDSTRLGSVWLASRDDAERIATYTENLATMTPDEIRALSAQVRETAAETWPEMEPG